MVELKKKFEPEDRARSFSNLSPTTVGSSPSTIGVVASSGLDEGQLTQLAQEVEVRSFVDRVNNVWTNYSDDEKVRAWQKWNETERALLSNYGLDVPARNRVARFFGDAWDLNATYNPFIAGPYWALRGWGAVIDHGKQAVRANLLMREASDQLPQQDDYNFATLEDNPIIDTFFAGIIPASLKVSTMRKYWDLAGANGESAFSNQAHEHIREAGWDEASITILEELAARSDWHMDDLTQEETLGLLDAYLNEQVKSGAFEPEDAAGLFLNFQEQLSKDSRVLESVNVLAKNKVSVGRAMARASGAEPGSWAYRTISGAGDLGIDILVDPTTFAGYGLRVVRASQFGIAVNGAAAPLDLARKSLSRQARKEHWGNLATEGTATEVLDATVALVRERGPSVLNDDVGRAYTVIAETLNAQRARWVDEVNAGRLPDKQGQFDLASEGILGRVRDPLNAIRHTYRKLAPAAADIFRRSGQADDALGIVPRGVRQTDQGWELTDDVFTEADVLEFFGEAEMMRKYILGGAPGSHLRGVPVLPFVTRSGELAGKTKAMLGATIDWMEDRPLDVLNKLRQAGKFTDEEWTAILDRTADDIGLGSFVGRISVSTADGRVAAAGLHPVMGAAAKSSQIVGKVLSMGTKLAPAGPIDLADPTSHMLIEDLGALLPPSVRGDLTRAYQGTKSIAQRVTIVRNVLEETFTHLGIYDTEEGAEWANRFLGQMMETMGNTEALGQIYGMGGHGVRRINGGREVAMAITLGQTSTMMAVPDFRRLYALASRGKLVKALTGYNVFNSNFMDFAIGKVWAPAVLLRMGFAVRAGGEEAAQFMLREGVTSWVRARAAVSSQSDKALLEPMWHAFDWMADTIARTGSIGTGAADVWRSARTPERLLGSFWGDHIYKAIQAGKVPALLGKKGVRSAQKALAGKRYIDGVTDLATYHESWFGRMVTDFARATDSVSAKRGDLYRFSDHVGDPRQRQLLEGKDVNGPLEQPDEWWMADVYTGKWQELGDKDDILFYKAYERRMNELAGTEDGRLAIGLFRDVLAEADGRTLDEVRERFAIAFSELVEQDPDLARQMFDRLTRLQATKDGRSYMEADAFSALLPKAFGYHGTASPIPYDPLLAKAAQDGSYTHKLSREVTEVRRIASRQEQLTSAVDQLDQWVAFAERMDHSYDTAEEALADFVRWVVGGGEGGIKRDIADTFGGDIPEELVQQLRPLIRLMFPNFNRSMSTEDIISRFASVRANSRKHLEELARSREQEIQRLSMEYGISPRAWDDRNVIHAKAVEYGEEITRLRSALREARASGRPDEVDRIAAELVEVEELQKQALFWDGGPAGAAFDPPPGALALEDRRGIPQHLGEGNQVHGRGTYLAMDSPEQSVNHYANVGANASPTLYAFEMAGEWNPVRLAYALDASAYDATQGVVDQLFNAMLDEVESGVSRIPWTPDAGSWVYASDATIQRGIRLGLLDEGFEAGSYSSYLKRFNDEVGDPKKPHHAAMGAIGTASHAQSVIGNMANFYGRNRDEVWDLWQDALSVKGYNGFEQLQLNDINGLGGRQNVARQSRVAVVWDARDLTAKERFNPIAIKELAEDFSTRKEVLSDLGEDWFDLIRERTFRYAPDGTLTDQPLFDDVYDRMLGESGNPVHHDDLISFDKRPQEFERAVTSDVSEAFYDSDVPGSQLARMVDSVQGATDEFEGEIGAELVDQLRVLSLDPSVETSEIQRILDEGFGEMDLEGGRFVSEPLKHYDPVAKVFNLDGQMVTVQDLRDGIRLNEAEKALREMVAPLGSKAKVPDNLTFMVENTAGDLVPHGFTKPDGTLVSSVDELTEEMQQTISQWEELTGSSVFDDRPTQMGRLAKTTATPEVERIKIGYIERFFKKPFEVLGHTINYISRTPMLVHNYVKAKEFAESMWAYRPFEKSMHDTLQKLGYENAKDLKYEIGRIRSEYDEYVLRVSGDGGQARPFEEWFSSTHKDLNRRYKDIAFEAHHNHGDVFLREQEEGLLSYMDRLGERIFEAETFIFQTAFERAIANTAAHIDNKPIGSFLASMGRNYVPFYWAQERFLKRTAQTLFHSPEAVMKLSLMYHGLQHSGMVYTDSNGNEYFHYMGDGLALDAVSAILERMPGDMRVPQLVSDTGKVVSNVSDLFGFSGRLDQVLPGLSDGVTPAVGPGVSSPLKLIGRLFPALNDFTRPVIGEIGADRPVWEGLMPTSILRFYQMLDAPEQLASAHLQAVQTLTAAGFDPPDDSVSEWETFMERTRNLTHIIGGLRLAFGLVVPASPRIEFEGSDLNQELIQLITTYGFEDGMVRWTQKNPDSEAFTVFQTRSKGGAHLPATEKTFQFIDEHQDVFSRYKHLAPFIIPREVGESVYYNRAFNQQLAMGLRTRRSDTEMYRAIKFAEAAPQYFEERDNFNRDLEAAGDNADQKRALNNAWGIWSKKYKRAYPIFAQELESRDRQDVRDNVVGEFDAFFNNEYLTNPAFNNPTINAVKMMHDNFRQYQGLMEQMSGLRRGAETEFKKAHKDGFARWAFKWMHQHPWTEDYYLRIILPELQLQREDVEEQFAIAAGE